MNALEQYRILSMIMFGFTDNKPFPRPKKRRGNRLWLSFKQSGVILYTKHYRFGIGFDYTEYDGLRFCKSYKKGRYIAAYIPLYRVLVTISLSRE